MISNKIPLTNPLIQKVKCCKNEKNRHANTVQHCNVNNIENIGLLSMNQVGSTKPKLIELGH